MTITIQIATDSEQWNELLQRAPHRTIFHTWEWLKIVEKHTKTKLYPLVGFKANDPVGLFPLFYQKKGFFKLVFSPPSSAGIIYLGPLIIDYEIMKQGKKESTFFEFLKESDKFISSRLRANYVRIRLSPGLLDSRPFVWSGYNVYPLYTLTVDLTKTLDAIRANFDRKFRGGIDKSYREGVSVEQGSMEDLDFLHDSLAKRMREQGFDVNIPQKYLHDLSESFYPQNLKVFVAKYKGQNVGGAIVLCYNDKASLWIGIPKSSLKGVYPNDVVQWEIIKWAKENGFKYFEMMDTGEAQRLCNYKSQINPDLSIWFSAIKYSSKVHYLMGKLYGSAHNIIRSKKLPRLEGGLG